MGTDQRKSWNKTDDELGLQNTLYYSAILAGDPVPYVKWAANSHKAAVCYTRPITKEVVKGINGKWKGESMPSVQHMLINSNTAAKGRQKLHMGLELCMGKMESRNTAKGFFLFATFQYFRHAEILERELCLWF